MWLSDSIGANTFTLCTVAAVMDLYMSILISLTLIFWEGHKGHGNKEELNLFFSSKALSVINPWSIED